MLEEEIKEYETPEEGKIKDDPKLLKIKQIKVNKRNESIM
jgi:hypothetical protein